MNKYTTSSNRNPVKSALNKIQSSKQLPFTDILKAEHIREKVKGVEYRERVFTPELTTYAFLAQVTDADKSCQMAVNKVIAHKIRNNDPVPSANTAAYCEARARLPEKLLSDLSKECAVSADNQGETAWLWRERSVKLVDGATLSMPDTPANQAVWPQSSAQKKAWDFRYCA